MRHLNIKNSLFVALLATTTLVGCKKDDYAPLGESYSVTAESVTGTWKLSSVIEEDVQAVAKGYPASVQSEDITSAYSFTDYEISITSNESQTSGGFTVTNTNSAPVMLPASGNWKFYDPNGPRQLKMVAAGSQDTVLVEFATIYQKSQNKLALAFSRKDGDGESYLVYKYYFDRK